MKLTIIVDDKSVYVDGVAFHDLALTGAPTDVHALQWDGTSGWIEYKDDAIQNENIDALPAWADEAVVEWNEAKKASENKPKSPSEILQEEVTAVHKQYPAADNSAINKLIGARYPNLVIKPTIREADSAVIGISVEATSGYDNNTGTVGLLSLRTCTNDAIALGVPMLSPIIPRDGTITKDEFAAFLLSISEYNKIIYNDAANYVYQDWNIQFAKNRKRSVINTERDVKINGGTTWNGNKWDTDDVSRSNLTAALAAVNVGVVLPEGFAWRTADNINVPFTAQDVKDLNTAVSAFVNTCYQESWTRKAALDALPADCTYAQIDAI